jgi:uncharacterized protein
MMKLTQAYRFWILFFTLVVLIQTGCARTQQSRFYALNPISEKMIATSPNLSMNGKNIGIGRVEIPSHLDRPQIVTQKGPHQIHLAEYERWAFNLRENIKSVIAENLSTLLPDSNVYILPWRGMRPIHHQITIRIIRFDTFPGETVFLDARWVLLEEDDRQILLEQGSQIQIPLPGEEYDDIVAVQSQALGELSREIAEAIQTLAASSE